MHRVLPVVLLAFGFGALPAFGQGRTDYVNFESPAVHNLEVITLDGHDYLAVCNTPNSSVDFYDTDETVSERLLARVRVGQEPVSCRYNERLQRLYTANFVGDSVSIIAIGSDGPGSIRGLLVETTWVGDEPLDIAFYTRAIGGEDTEETMVISHMALDGIDWRNAVSLAPISGAAMIPALVANVPVDINPPDGNPEALVENALKEPRAIEVRGDDLLVLGLKGNDLPFGFDLFCDDLTNFGVSPLALDGLGTTGFDMAFNAAGDLYVVGGRALNAQLFDEPKVAAAETGFTESVLYLVQDPCSGNPTIQARDINIVLSALQPQQPFQQPFTTGKAVIGQPILKPTPVKKGQALAMPTDVIAYQTANGPKAFLTAFSSDRVGVFEPDPAASDPNSWPRRKIGIPAPAGNPMAGPRNLALKLANPAMVNDPGARLYVYNRLDNSVVSIDPDAETVVTGTELVLADPTPSYVRAGQKFLYSAKLSRNGTVSCATCHVDARTDGQTWDLGTPALGPVAIGDELIDGIDLNPQEWPADKQFMVTQSLQGLLNYETDPAQIDLVTNGPYHWRADRENFQAFNGAFASLLGGSQLLTSEIDAYTEYINSVHYPPNPQERFERTLSGAFDDGGGQPFPNDGSTGAFRGLKHFHITATVGARACGHCHATPEGSNNRINDLISNQPVEAAALRGLLQKEGKRDIDGFSDPELSPYTRFLGMLHPGFQFNPANPLEVNRTGTINSFVRRFFSDTLCGTLGLYCTELGTLSQFVHEMDWHMGPLVGCPMTVTTQNASQALGTAAPPACDLACTDLQATLTCMEQQADEANSAVAVHAWIGGAAGGFWYDPTADGYRQEPTGAGAPLSRAALLALLTASRDRMVFQAVPLGSHRRLAHPDGDPDPLPAGAAPSQITLLPMAPNSFYERLPELDQNWATFNNSSLQAAFIHSTRLLQWGLIQDAAGQSGFGFGSQLRHDAPRRLRVAGDDIRDGAQLILLQHADSTGGPPNPAGGPDQFATRQIVLPLYATDDTTPEELPIWETALELEPLVYYSWMMGGPEAPNVTAALTDYDFTQITLVDPVLDQPPVGTFDPLNWNLLYVQVQNTDGGVGTGGWQPLQLE